MTEYWICVKEWRIWSYIPYSPSDTDEFQWQLTNLNAEFLKLIDKRRMLMTIWRNWILDLNEVSFSGRNWIENWWNWMLRWRKWAGKPIIIQQFKFMNFDLKFDNIHTGWLSYCDFIISFVINTGFPAHFRHLFIISFFNFQFNFVPRSFLPSNPKFNFVELSFILNFVLCQSNLKVKQLKSVSAAKRAIGMLGSNSLFCHSNSWSVIWAFIFGRRFCVQLWQKWMPMDEIDFAVSCSATVTDEFELQLTKRVTRHKIEWQRFKTDRPKTKLKRAFAHSRVSGMSGTKLKTDFFILFFIQSHSIVLVDLNGFP